MLFDMETEPSAVTLLEIKWVQLRRLDVLSG